jgi:golgi SNAP receptor complex member 1
MATPTPQSYSSLRSDLRHQESKTEIALAELSSLINSSPSQQDIHIEDRLLEIFAQRRETIDNMARLLDTDPSGGGARVHQVSRAREILVEHEKEFRRMKVHNLVLPKLMISRRYSRLKTGKR